MSKKPSAKQAKETKQPEKRAREWGEDRVKGTSPTLKPTKWKPYFPAPTGDIDLNVTDMPQPQCALEWWYYNCHVVTKKTQRKLSLFSSLFRQAAPDAAKCGDVPEGERDFFSANTWAIIDVDRQMYLPDSVLDHRTPDILKHRLSPESTGKKPQHVEAALLELAKQGKVPLPDRLAKKKANCSRDELNVTVGDCSLRKVKAVNPSKIPGVSPYAYHIQCSNPSTDCAIDLIFTPQQNVIRHGFNGVVNDMFYYYVPRCTVTGTCTINGEEEEVEGSGWYDREFGGEVDESVSTDALDAWTWFSVQMSDGYDFTYFNVVDRDTNHEKEKVCVLSDKNGNKVATSDVQLTYKNMWTSMTTYVDYPTEWRLVVPSWELELHMTAAVKHQEFMTIIVTGGGFYEGRMHATGSHKGNAVTGTGFLERKNHSAYKDTKGLLNNVGRIVKRTLQDLYPADASKEWLDKYVLGRNTQPAGIDPKNVCKTLFMPVRSLIDRGGKSWRSLIMVSAINAIARHDRFVDCSKYIAMAELLHVGSLVIDDIQDESNIRRGGMTVHKEFGLAHAINAGTAAYFMTPILAGVEDLPNDQQLKMYQLYFDTMRAGHAGQGLDLLGLDHLMPAAVETGEVQQLLDSLRAIHIFKTGGAAGTMTRMACVITSASAAQADALENYGVQIGLAFQIVDDALNLRGFEGELKEVGEDIRDGKITYPVIKALGRLSKTDRKYIWSILQEKTEDRGKIASVISLLNSVGAIDDCLVEARNYVEEAWARLDPVLPDSLPKLMMRTFSLYLTERTF